jgi:phosphoribosylaminoimidazole-succinocarboxamide synthase
MISCDPTDFPETAGSVSGRAMLVHRTAPIRLECVVRGYLAGSAWREYRERGTVHGRDAQYGLLEASALPEPLFTPTTKAEEGHDLPLSDDEAIELVGRDRFDRLRDLSLQIYERGHERARAAGLVLADTKLEFGELDGELLVIDEMLTLDSSRYWPADEWAPGASPPAFDKQIVRDAMDATGWNHEPPPPPVPPQVIAGTRARYIECYELLTGCSFDDWFDVTDA